MNKLKRTLGLLTFTLATGLAVLAQTQLPVQVEVYRPAELSQNLIRQSDIAKLSKSNTWGQKKNPANPKHWVVYSDRANNTTYQSPNKNSGKFDTLKFNEKLRIAQIKDGYALVYTEPKQGLSYPLISEVAKTRGWVPMSNLLLWESCPVNEKDIYQKALLVANLDNAGEENNDMGYAYNNPETRSQIGSIITDMTFYFVMKTDPKSGLVLLARQARLDGASDQMLYGWVNKNSYTPWNQRSCLEPNWNPDDVSYFNSPQGKVYGFYKEPTMKTVVSGYVYGNKYANDKNSNTYYRMDPHQTRFPILDNDTKNNNIFKCTSFGGNGRDVRVVNQTNEDSKGKELIEQFTKQIQNINLIFVIDGTQSMKPYFASAKNAIKRSIDYFDKQKYNIKAAVVIYRDYADGDALVEVQPLVAANDVRLGKFLDEVGAMGYGAASSPNDHTHTEALYKGLDAALNAKAIGYEPSHANMMLVIGDCGNALDDSQAPSEDKLIKKLVDNNVHLMSYQVRNNSAEAWQLFNSQMSKIIRQNMVDQYGKRNISAKVKFKPNKLGYDINNGTDRQFFVGSMRFEDEGKDMDPNQLSKLIENNIRNFSEAIQVQIDALQGVTSDTGFAANTSEDNSSVKFNEEFVISVIGEERYKKMKDRNVTMATTAYTPKQDKSGRDYWKPIIFLSTAELDNLLERLAPVYDQANAVKESNNRKPYIDAVKGLLRAMVPDITDAEMDEKGLADVMNMISGLNVTSNALDYSLLDLQDVHKVKHDVFQSLVNDFCDKYEKVRRIRGSKYMYSFENNNIRYYWIPVEDLP